MNDIEKLLLKAAKQGLAELSKQGIGLYDEKCEKESIIFLMEKLI